MPPGTRRPRFVPLPFSYKLVLNHWILSLFNVGKFEKLAELVRNEALEGMDENNVHHFHHALTAQLFNLTQLPTDLLLEYDQNIVKHTLRLNEKRITRGEEPIKWKYFQYLSLLFTEIYLDRYFSDADSLLTSINEQIEKYNDGKDPRDQITPLDTASEAATQLNKLSFWMATGSGKTLLMHANILQYQHYLDKHKRGKELNRIILLTPNEGLSEQHFREFEAAGIYAEMFRKDGRGLYAGKAVEIIEVTKLKDDMGDKTVAVDAFEGNNLVLVDEGHRGASGGGDGVWMKFRNKLCENGFSFEYSATFGQAVKAVSVPADQKKLTELYAKNILIDYSYKYFYGDGFGKDYQILNLQDDTNSEWMEKYLTACLLSFYQQLRLYREQEATLRPFNLEKPLWIFVGGKVTATLASRDASDIVEILKFIARYVSERPTSIGRIDQILRRGLVTANERNLFDGRFAFLNSAGLSADQIFDDTLSTLFNSAAGGTLYIENLKGATGEIALRLGADSEPFGVINVGDDSKLVKLCEDNGMDTGDREFSGSLFHSINKDDSTVNMLIGSKKFTEGWSSWRVSTMGLMNVGRGEGSQIIQLFGRGVRLKGINMSLKRSGQARLPDGLERPKDIGVLETLGIFGIRADYMAQFREYLKDEGLPTNEDKEEILLPVIKNLGTQKLKTIRLKKTINGVSTEFGDAFRKLGPIPTVQKPDIESDPSTSYLFRNQVVVNWYPKIQAMRAKGLSTGDGEATLNEAHLTSKHVAFVDIDRIVFELGRFKAERGWYNLNLTRNRIIDLLTDRGWYQLLIPADELAFDSFAKVNQWEEIAISLLKKYTERYYTFRKREWELPHLEYRDLESNDPNLVGVGKEVGDPYYRIMIEASRDQIIAKLTELKTTIESGKLSDWKFGEVNALCFDRHIFKPLMHLDSKVVEISPAPMNDGEKHFVEDLRLFYDDNAAYFESKELYLLRNLSKGKGVGFFEAGNFHPDFILWLLEGDQQHIAFIDPKGLRNVGPKDPKVEFYKTIKEIETRLDDPKVHLHSFIVSNTAFYSMLWDMKKDEMHRRNICFQDEDKDTYIGFILDRIRGDCGTH
jgi:hypothetical protein